MLTLFHGVTRFIRLVAVATAVAGGGEDLAAHNCTCRAGGQNYPQGQVLCLRGKLARCEMFLNNSSWKIIADSCPVSSLPSARIASRMHSSTLSLAADRCIAQSSLLIQR